MKVQGLGLGREGSRFRAFVVRGVLQCRNVGLSGRTTGMSPSSSTIRKNVIGWDVAPYTNSP